MVAALSIRNSNHYIYIYIYIMLCVYYVIIQRISAVVRINMSILINSETYYFLWYHIFHGMLLLYLLLLMMTMIKALLVADT